MLSYIRSDLKVFGAGMVIFLIGMLTFFFGHVRWVVLPMLSCGCSLLVMLGIVGLMDWPVTVISANFISLQLIITNGTEHSLDRALHRSPLQAS